MKVGIIGGTGVYDSSWLTAAEELRLQTPYGSVTMMRGRVGENGDDVYFVNRHGPGHHVPPHLVNYRANIWSLHQVGVERIVATAAVGSLSATLFPGMVVLCDQFLDFTKSRSGTFFEGGQHGVVHTDMTDPYCPHLRSILFQHAGASGLSVANGGCYVTTEGPRFETPAEIRAFRILGGDVVGMTSVPEVVLARELGLCYSTVALVTNYAAGISSHYLTHQEVLDLMDQYKTSLNQLIRGSLPLIQQHRDCHCFTHQDGLTK
ncbi:MAG: S-methyl-5'-thioadenosine phosphorylase [Firmicutes bacterium]|jgi:5'-methylthioadenosine phosphorylase|uniref:Probable 6-oxopurine nucleoside phosphorylase n=1 Tax=Sulfobacillus benefaciens TaxID=453960 RepID=A0A2T2XB62_9FIRM|nr:S-methyl-5'-thioadenosine phosphorylase [Bacillota bacterium]MCL5015809.1 S-methyl-5'-thioadenosine phosphorylase [Bacillota bacterium]PSR31735.1 MAG: 5'-methylthioadenosine phosphorylase [Sulfobacillus benefaciens]